MNDVNLNRVELLQIVRENRQKHVDGYKEDVIKYKKLVLSILKENEKCILADDITNIKNIPSEPSNYIVDYDRAIRMLELSIDDTITLSEKDFNRLVLDEWNWTSGLLMEKLRYLT